MKASKPASTSDATRRSASLGVLPPGYLPASRRSSMTQYDSPMGLFRDFDSVGIEPREIESPRIGQMSVFHVPERGENGFGASRLLPLPLGQHALDLFSLGVVLGSAELAGNDWELACTSVTLDQRLGDVCQRADDNVAAIVRLELGRHGLESAAMKQVQEQRLDDVVAVMAQRDLGNAVFRRVAVQRAAAQPRTQLAHRLAFRDDALDHAVRVLLDHVE